MGTKRKKLTVDDNELPKIQSKKKKLDLNEIKNVTRQRDQKISKSNNGEKTDDAVRASVFKTNANSDSTKTTNSHVHNPMKKKIWKARKKFSTTLAKTAGANPAQTGERISVGLNVINKKNAPSINKDSVTEKTSQGNSEKNFLKRKNKRESKLRKRKFNTKTPSSSKGPPNATTAKPSPIESLSQMEMVKTSPSETQPQMKTVKPNPSENQPQTKTVKPSPSENQPQMKTVKPSPSETQPQMKMVKPSPSENQPQTKTVKPNPSENQPQMKTVKPSPSENQPQTKMFKPSPSENQPQMKTVKPGDFSNNWKMLQGILSKEKKKPTFHPRKKFTKFKEKNDPVAENLDVNKEKVDESPVIWFDDVDDILIESLKKADSKPVKPDGKSTTNQSDDRLVKAGSFEGLTKAVAIDCEMVGVGERGRDSVLARVSIVNHFGRCVYDKYVKPREPVTDYRTHVSGIRPQDLKTGIEFKVAQKEVSDIFKNRLLVGHALENDLKVLFLDHPQRMIRDTSQYKPFRQVFSGRKPSLKKLSEAVLRVKVQEGEHNSVQDAQAAMRLYTMYRQQWEKEVKLKHKPKSKPSKKKKLSS